MCGIYKVTNLINGHAYIGQSVCIEERWKDHRHKPFNPNSNQYNNAFYMAIRKYGLDNFSFEVIEECEPEELNEKEAYWINFFNTFEEGYNETKGGDGISGVEYKLSDQQVLEIYSLLKDTTVSQQEIAKKYGVSQNCVSEINRGIIRVHKGIIYPLRSEEDSYSKRFPNHICPICGQRKEKEAKTCVACYKELVSSHLPSRTVLKDLIRNKSFVQIGKDFNVSDNAVRKWCDKYGLPRKKSDIKKISDEDWEKI